MNDSFPLSSRYVIEEFSPRIHHQFILHRRRVVECLGLRVRVLLVSRRVKSAIEGSPRRFTEQQSESVFANERANTHYPTRSFGRSVDSRRLDVEFRECKLHQSLICYHCHRRDAVAVAATVTATAAAQETREYRSVRQGATFSIFAL